MDYLFFDIECANCDGGNGKICSFGYVLADEQLNAVQKADIIINPRAPFRLKGWGNKSYITLAYPEAVFKAAPDFGKFYGEIASLLDAQDRMIFGYAPENDAGFLRSEFDRYKKTPVDFTFCDVQRIYKNAIGTQSGQLCSLTAACEALEIDTEFTEHKSCDDAYATMLVLKKVCELKGMCPSELTEKFAPCKGRLENGELEADYFKPRSELKSSEKNMIKGINRDAFRSLQRRLSAVKNDGVFDNKRICFSWLYEYYHYREMTVILNAISENGGRYVHKVSECDVFVKKPDSQRGNCKRYEEFKTTRKKAKEVLFSEFLEIIGLDEKTLSEKAKEIENAKSK